MLNKNTTPYFDSFEEDQQFHQVLFRPSFPVQARELNEMQSILQNQIERFGKHVFKEGSMVIPGQISLDQKYAYVKLESQFGGYNIIPNLEDILEEGITIRGETSGVTAKVINYLDATDTDPVTIFVKYVGSGTDGVTSVFSPSETLGTVEETPRRMTVLGADDHPTGIGSAVNVQRGVYFVRGKFVLVREQTLVISKYDNIQDAKVGLVIAEQFITAEDDERLLDNAQGSSNYTAPGAHRHYINLTLSMDDGSANFVELIVIKGGEIQKIQDKSVYSVLEETLARRTYDESGNYTVTPFSIQVNEHRDNNRGDWKQNTRYEIGDVFKANGKTYVVETAGISGTVAPNHSFGVAVDGGITATYEPNPSYNNGTFSVENGGDASKIAIGIGAGKAYVLGHEISNPGTKFIGVQKADTFDSQRAGVIPVTIGSYVKVDKLSGSLNIAQFPTVTLYDKYVTVNGTPAGNVVGTAVARYVEYDSGTIGSASYILSLVDIKLNSGRRFEADVRSVYFNNIVGADFTANIQKTLTILTGSYTTTSGSSLVTGLGTAFVSELSVGDAILMYNGGSEVIYNVASIESDTRLNLTENVSVSLSNVSAYKSVSTIYQASEGTMLMKIPHDYVRKVRDIDNENVSSTSYYCRQVFSSTVTGGSIAISTVNTAETFASPQQPDNFMVINATTGAVLNPSITLNPQANTATMSIGAGANGNVITVIATVRRTLRERSKTIVRYRSEDFINQSDVVGNIINLAKTDGIKLRKVIAFSVSGVPLPFGSSIPSSGVTEIDITKSFIFDGGQKDAFYDNSKLIRQLGSSAPSSPIRVVYDYYEHGTTGDYFSVDSYAQTAPTYRTSSGKNIALRDYLDFRPNRSSGVFASVSVPAIGYDVIADYTYYLPRYDKIYLSGSGTFGVVTGVPSVNPKAPDTPSDSMLLANVAVTAKTETVGADTVSIETVDNRRYTMRDIAAIDKRLQNVEYYTALSLLEQQTHNLQLFDDNGNLNFKNGFIVDPFTGQNIADVASDDFRCSIDPVKTLMRPAFSIDNVSFIEKVSTIAARSAAHYVENDGIITLPFTEVAEIVQPFATRVESITPFLQFRFNGDAKLIPASDEWYETARAPAVIVNREGNYSALAEQFRSQMGTVWNAWQTNWTTSSSRDSTSTTTNRFVDTTTTTRTTTTTQGQSRTGTNTTIQAVYDNQVVDDRVIRVDLIPWMRSRPVAFVAKGLKASTKMYPFFDSKNVSEYVSAASTIMFASKSGTFNTETSAGSDANHISRKDTLGNPVSAFSVGDVIHNGSSGILSNATATAVVLLDEDLSVRVINVKGTFSAGQTVYGTISGSTGVVSSISTNSELITNEYGEVCGLFNIPANDVMRFQCGQRIFAVSSSETNDKEAECFAAATYTATGYLQTKQQTIVSTRNAIINQARVSDSRVVSSENTAVIGQTVVDRTPSPPPISLFSWDSDPLAQSFTIVPQTGFFVSSVDVFFAGKDKSIPMWFNIVEVVNGTPTKNVLPGSHIVMKPNQITTSSDSSIATKMKMKFPVYLQPNREYAFVMGSESTKYSVWVSHLGETDKLTGKMISQQPYLGSMFKSQNASSWNPAQLDDIKFVINRADFDISKAANVEFIAEDLSVVALQNNPVFTRNGNNKVRVMMNNHGLKTGNVVTISGCSDVFGIPAVEFNKQHTVIAAEFDSFVIGVSTNANYTGFGGGSNVVASRNVRFDLAQVVATQLVFNSTSIKHFLQTTSADFVKQAEAVEVSTNENVQMPEPMIVGSKENEEELMDTNRSLESIAQLQSGTSYLSPVLDTRRYSGILIGNRIDFPTTAMNISGLDTYQVGVSNEIRFGGSSILTDSIAGKQIFKQLKVGAYLAISGSANVENNGTFLITSINSDFSQVVLDATFTSTNAPDSIALVLHDRYVSEVAPVGGSCSAKYVIKSMSLDLPATQLSVFVDVNKPASVDVEFYYRVGESGEDLSKKNWTQIQPQSAIKSTDNQYSYDGVICKLTSQNSFSSAQVKIVQKSTNTCKVAQFKNLRMIAMT